MVNRDTLRSREFADYVPQFPERQENVAILVELDDLPAPGYDFDPAVDAVPLGELPEIDRYALARYAAAGERIVRAYEGYEFSSIFQALNTLATVDLSAFYVDVAKDTLYTLAPKSPARRAAQTAMFTIADGLARLMAPILPMTADELWRFLPGKREESVHLAVFPDRLEAFADADLGARWSELIAIRDQVNVALEAQRKDKVIGNSLAAKVTLEASGPTRELLERYRGELPAIFIVAVLATSIIVSLLRPRKAATNVAPLPEPTSVKS